MISPEFRLPAPPGPNTRPAPKWPSPSSLSLALGMVRLEPVVLQEAFNVSKWVFYQDFFVGDLLDSLLNVARRFKVNPTR